SGLRTFEATFAYRGRDAHCRQLLTAHARSGRCRTVWRTDQVDSERAFLVGPGTDGMRHVLLRCIRMIALGAMGRLLWPILPKKDRRMSELDERKFQKIFENVATGIALAKMDGRF